MSKPIALETIISSIRNQFRGGPPNGWLLGWDESRCFPLVAAAAAPYPTINHTSFDYGFCNWFEVRIDDTSDGYYWTLTIKLSFIVPTYGFHWTRYESLTQGVVSPAAPAGYQVVEDEVRMALENAGFFELPAKWYEQELQGVELELSGTKGVTLSKCLFNDYSEQ